MVIIDYLLPYNNFIVFFSIVILNIILIFKRSYWQTFIIGNLLLLAFLVIIGFDPLQTFLDTIGVIFDFFGRFLKQFWDLIKSIFS